MRLVLPTIKFESIANPQQLETLSPLGVNLVYLANAAITFYRRNLQYVKGVGVVGVRRPIHVDDLDHCLADILDDLSERYIETAQFHGPKTRLKMSFSIFLSIMYDTLLPYLDMLVRESGIRFIPEINHYHIEVIAAVSGGVILECYPCSTQQHGWSKYATINFGSITQ